MQLLSVCGVCVRERERVDAIFDLVPFGLGFSMGPLHMGGGI